ncbi:MAG: hypothetical protein H0V67_04365 [Geodermatophilaceae bacterium]|nr:hypothetical protein [Geodermatophilaceae bacterium]
MPASTPRPPQPKRWGLRTLLFLGLAAASVIASNLLYADGNNDFVLLTTAGVVIGFVGATFASIRGIRSWRGSQGP